MVVKIALGRSMERSISDRVRKIIAEQNDIEIVDFSDADRCPLEIMERQERKLAKLDDWDSYYPKPATFNKRFPRR